jgi:hypothetical protein
MCISKFLINYSLCVCHLDPMPPFIYKTNMNKNISKVIEMTPKSHKNVTLQCFVKGMPTPIVTWYKVCHLYFLNIINLIKLIVINIIFHPFIMFRTMKEHQ